MILKIVADPNYSSSLGEYSLTLQQFANKAYYPYIATEKWDKAYIEVTNETPHGVIKQLIDKCEVVPIIDITSVTLPMVQVLCELVPDSAVELRFLYSRDKEALRRRLSELADLYDWQVISHECMS